MLYRILILVACSFIFTIGVTVGHYKYPPFNYAQKLKPFFISTDQGSKINNKFEICELPVVNSVMANSHAFIGHAYGAPTKANQSDFLAENVLKFIQKYKHQLKSVSFTGDVFSVPSLAKWERLSKLFVSPQKIFIAPGNHDIARPDSRDIFDLSIFGTKSYPFVESLDNVSVVFDDSVSSKWLVSNEMLELVYSLSSSNIIIARHNIPITDLLHLANSKAEKSDELPDLENFVSRFPVDVSYTWIIGDGGAFLKLPRLSCLKYADHTFIVNGIGQVLGDSVVIYNNGQLYKYTL
jgi:hypothetical protein